MGTSPAASPDGMGSPHRPCSLLWSQRSPRLPSCFPPGSVCPFGGVPSQPCLQDKHGQRVGRGGTLLSPVLRMVPRAVPASPRGHSRVLPCSCAFAASAHSRFAFVGTMWAARCLEVGRCPSGLVAPEASAGHPQKGHKQPKGGERGWGTFAGSSSEGPASPGARQGAWG